MNIKTFAFLVLACLILRPDSSHAAIRVEEDKNAAGVITQQRFYDGNKFIEVRYFNQQGVLGTWLRFQYPSVGHVIRTNMSVLPEEKNRIMTQEEWTGLSEKNETQAGAVRLRSWVYNSSAPYALEYIANYDLKKTSQINSKNYVDEKNQVKSTLVFTYQENREKPVAFVETDLKGQVLSKYSLFEKYDLPTTLREQGKTAAEINALQAQRENPDKFLVAIIDTGFDYNHADLVTKWWNNPTDPIDGIDNDGNGWIDDNFGWEQGSNQYLPSEAIISFAKDSRPLSHGTHVAAIAAQDLNNIGLIGFAGEYTDVPYMDKVSAFIKKHKVKVVNMSLAIPLDHKDQLGLKTTVRAYQRMIESNPDTLFVVASGNEIKDLDLHANRQYPSSFMNPNVLKVGALDVGSIAAIDPIKTKAAYFSNWGKNSVDILAPGWEVMAAGLGGGLIAHSGTSMATPYMVNQIVQLWSALPHLTAKEVRELFIATAHKMNPEPLIRSGGYVDLKAALLEGRIQMLKGQQTSVTGPNCWNASTLLAGISNDVHYTTEEEFRFIVDSQLCTKIALSETKKGDIIALRRFDSAGKILPMAFMSEVHGYTDLGDGNGLTKNGNDKSIGYEVQSKADIFNFYKSKEFKNCKMIGLDKKDCILKETAYRCQSVREASAGKLSVLENDVLSQIEQLEKELGLYFLKGQAIQGNKLQRISEIEGRVDDLRAQGSKAALLTFMAYRLKSLSSQF